ncbi:hypothetical protein CDO44_04125 [Pigmentiphaga sp. NML080357]|uniref:CopD family protein n=1 Tax=Pigmentiphaga sp. NML080357 TaxID=2008675 RepID=UPI000B41EA01|nr:CopD family protein [Pigmentiphaga sp. NML080357]OVZ62811.1 hypothetical protein CDO44_04125 [Pigmentiphaga sp. NML080357]
MIYPWLKALHAATALTWTGGLLAAAMAIQACAGAKVPADTADRRRALDTVRRWDRHVTSPAMLLAWVLGIAIAIQGEWFGSLWLAIKLGFVVFLSAMHGLATGTLKRLALGSLPSPSSALRHIPAATVASIAVIAVLAVVKPF